MNPVKRLLKLTAYLLFIALLGAGVVEGALASQLIRPSFDMSGYRIVLDSKMLYKLKPSQEIHINAYGFRGDLPAQKKEKNRILFIGDSFVLGAWLSESKTVPALLGKKLGPNFEVLNLGIQGYGPDQTLAQFLELAPKLDPDGVILGIYPANDYNDLLKNELISLDEKGGILFNKGNVVSRMLSRWQIVNLFSYLTYRLGWTEQPYKDLFVRLFGDGYDHTLLREPKAPVSLKKIMTMRAILKRLKDECASRNIPFLVVIFPSYEAIQDREMFEKLQIPDSQLFMLEDMTAQICDSLGITFVNPHNVFQQFAQGGRLYSEEDKHFNELGAQIAAESIYRRISA